LANIHRLRWGLGDGNETLITLSRGLGLPWFYRLVAWESPDERDRSAR